MKGSRPTIDLTRAELARLLEHARPSLTAQEYEQLRAALDTLALMMSALQGRNATIQMCDALSRNFCGPYKTILAHCIAHSRRKYVEVAPHFPAECLFVLDLLGEVYRNDAECGRRKLPPRERLA